MLKKGIRFFVLSMGILILSGYTFAASESLFKNGTLKLDKINEGKIRITSVIARVDGGGVKLSGKVKKTGTGYVKSGHIDLVVISPEGEVLKETNISYIPKNLNLRKRHSHGSGFYAELPFIPPKGSVVRMAFHKASVKKEKYTCMDNRAVMED